VKTATQHPINQMFYGNYELFVDDRRLKPVFISVCLTLIVIFLSSCLSTIPVTSGARNIKEGEFDPYLSWGVNLSYYDWQWGFGVGELL